MIVCMNIYRPLSAGVTWWSSPGVFVTSDLKCFEDAGRLEKHHINDQTFKAKTEDIIPKMTGNIFSLCEIPL